MATFRQIRTLVMCTGSVCQSAVTACPARRSFSCPDKLLLYGPRSPNAAKDRISRPMRPLLLLFLSLALSFPASATISESHGYAQFGTLKYPASFSHFDWVNPCLLYTSRCV